MLFNFSQMTLHFDCLSANFRNLSALSLKLSANSDDLSAFFFISALDILVALMPHK